jgi:anti-sigma factor RsiW
VEGIVRCSSCEILLDRYVEATLPARQMAAVSAHLKTCEACAELVNELRVIDALMATTKSVDLPANFTFAVMAEVRTTPVAVERRLSMWSLLVFYLVAAWIALSGGFALLGPRAGFVQHAFAAMWSGALDVFAAVTGIAHGVGPAAPVVVGIVCFVLFVDVLLAGALIFFHRSVRPRLAAVLARSEAS